MNPKWLLLVGLVALPSVAQAESSFDHDLAREVAVPGGLTARQVTSRASSASHTVSARRAEVEAAAAGVDRALSAYMPRVTLSGRYARLSDLEPPKQATSWSRRARQRGRCHLARRW